MDWRLFLKVLVVTTFISGAIASWVLYPIKDAGHVAAWIQAFGTIGAVAAAIYVVHLGNKKARNLADDLACEQAKKDEVAILSALNAELEVEWSRYLEMGGEMLEDHDENKGFDYFWMPPNPRFPIYQSLAHRVGAVGDKGVVEDVIKAYSFFGRLIVNFEANNREIVDLRALNLPVLQGVEGSQRIMKESLESMRRLASILVKCHSNTKSAVETARFSMRNRIKVLTSQIHEK
ncbi:hypothetical protein JQS35_11220 [Alcaligenes faecalis subsp. faecalis]|uniref:hypothetical protein n=1 Tax=Alcaligenes faecalis TaxID=511 RepID=UPI001F2A2AD5|nr:hypothetical protein [Alcaligenes faecalis]MBW4789170.1 hypothetical protein [Alcaligenes faecalis subsp. faecalis]